jgi:hypothetical protein
MSPSQAPIRLSRRARALPPARVCAISLKGAAARSATAAPRWERSPGGGRGFFDRRRREVMATPLEQVPTAKPGRHRKPKTHNDRQARGSKGVRRRHRRGEQAASESPRARQAAAPWLCVAVYAISLPIQLSDRCSQGSRDTGHACPARRVMKDTQRPDRTLHRRVSIRNGRANAGYLTPGCPPVSGSVAGTAVRHRQ